MLIFTSNSASLRLQSTNAFNCFAKMEKRNETQSFMERNTKSYGYNVFIDYVKTRKIKTK